MKIKRNHQRIDQKYDANNNVCEKFPYVLFERVR